MALNKAELACVYSALILVDDDVAVTVSILGPEKADFSWSIPGLALGEKKSVRASCKQIGGVLKLQLFLDRGGIQVKM